MSNADVRTDIRMQDVFISWTGKDRELKNQIVGYLRENGITMLESDHECAGDFRQWSCEAVPKCTVFLSLYTENTVNSEYVPIEIEEFKKLDDWRNRCLPVVSDYALYSEKYSDLAESESAVILNGRELSDEILSEILHKVQKLINNRLFKIYRNATQPTYLKLKSFLRMVNVQDREFNYETLYIHRTVTDEDENAIDDASVFATSKDIFFLQGPAGSGKSCYIDQLRKAPDENVIVMALPCRKLTNTSDIFKAMFEEFHRICGNRHFYTEEDFKSLLSVKHLLLVLDGMDEIATKSGTRQFLDAVSDYYKAHASSTTLFFTSRNGDDANIISMNGQSPKRLTLRSLEEDQIKQFGENLFLLLEKPDKSDSFYVRIKELADEIRTNPLLLSQLAIIYDKKDNIPQTTVGIYDAVCEITLSRESDVTNVPDKYRDMVTLELSSILKTFSAERYRLISVGKQPSVEKILATVLKNTYSDAKERAVFLAEYLRDRAMIIDGEFYHKMLLEYFTAVYYYEHCFDDYDELENEETLKDLFSHYDDPYWSAVLQLFLVKADSMINSKTTTELYRCLMTYGIAEYTLLFDTCRDLICHKEEAQRVLVGDILQKSADGTYPPYGPLFWYVPEYNLYSSLLLALENITEEPYFTKALALTRDVCWIFGHYNTANEITDHINGEELFSKCNLNGIRRGLCELFFTGDTAEIGGDDIYPRCFNLAEAKNWKEHGQGVLGRMNTAFEDELGLYSHEMFSELGGEYIGIVAAPYDRERLEAVLPQKSCKKLCGLFLSPTENTTLEKLSINDKHLRIIYASENTETINKFRWTRSFDRDIVIISNEIIYIYDVICIPNGIYEIDSFAFSNCKSLRSVFLPSALTTIRENAFSGCASLESILIPNTVVDIGNNAFEDCEALVSIVLPNSVLTLGYWAFKGCVNLGSITISNNITYILFGSFAKCKSLESIKLPDKLESIDGFSFENCEALTTISIPDRVKTIGCCAFQGCINLTLINNCPIGHDQQFLGVDCEIRYRVEEKNAEVIPNDIKTIEDWQFSGRRDIQRIEIPHGVITIGVGAFRGCSSLSSLTIPDSVTTIGCNAFEGCTSLSSISLPSHITQINYKTFNKCIAIEAISIPEKVTSIGEYAFSGCIALASIHIPDQVTTIGRNAFEGCTGLTCIFNCPKGYDKEFLGVKCEIYYREKQIVREILSDGVTQIDAHQFAGQKTLTEILVPKSVKRIGESAFEDCSSLESASIPTGVTLVDKFVFKGCESLTDISLPITIQEIEQEAFMGCKSLRTIDIPDSVLKIGWRAFAFCESLALINVPNGMTRISAGLFQGCESIKSITLPDGITEIGEWAFERCSSLESITIPNGVKEIKASAFEGCESLNSIVFPDSATNYWENVLKNCINLNTVILSNDIDRISVGMFEGCISLVSLHVPNGVTIIGCNAFSGCASLKLIHIPDGVTKIDASAFANCVSLASITIPSSVRCVEDDAFKGCTDLKEITISRRFEDELSHIFSNVDLSKITIHWI